MHKLLGSSVNPEKLSATIKGIVFVIVFLAGKYGIDIPNTDLETLGFQIAAIVSAVGVALAGARRIWNLYLKPYLDKKK